MKLTDKEIIKKLAEAVQDNYYESNPNGADTCRYCGVHLHGNYSHKDDCIMILANEVLSTELCTFCDGSGLAQLGDGEEWERTVNCDSCNGTGVKK